MEGLLETAKFALAGSVVGVTAAYAGDLVNARILNPILKPTEGTIPTPAGMYGRLAFQIVAGTLVAGGVIYAGDKLMDQIIVGDDPLFRTFYLLTAFTSMRLVNQNTQSTMAMLSSGVNQIFYPAARVANVPAGSGGYSYGAPAQQTKASGCAAKGGCGQ